MKKATYAVFIGLLAFLSYVAGMRHTARHAATSASATPRVLYWVDPMHPDYKSDHPGIAPDCGMQLEPVYAEPTGAAITSAEPLPPGTIGIDLYRQQLSGIRVGTVQKASGTKKVRVLGHVVPQDTRVYRI